MKMWKYRVVWRDLSGKKHREYIMAANSYRAAQMIRLKYDDVDLMISISLCKYQKED